MRMKDNGNPLICARNLMNMSLGECPFDRLRGRDPAMLDRPMGQSQAVQNAKLVLKLYEPRLDATVIRGGYVNANGDFVIDMELSDRKEGS
ncbi:MAG: hypothetical protein K2H85_08445 [Allobaculum sp.]|nr:hypothetical protein [Allobaculum sp.]